MDADKYQQLSARTINKKLGFAGNINNAALGLSGEAGEISDIIKKHLFHDHELDVQKLKLELGDVLWYVCQMATANGLMLSEIMEANVEKLRRRYPDGFSSQDSINRVE